MATSSSSAGPSSGTRLYVGNLHYSVDEYSLIKIFSRFGKVTKMDFLFHKTGEKRGKPRGYAFVELGTAEEAAKAVGKLHDHPLRGRNLIVTYASQMREDTGAVGRNASLMGDRRTTLSMVKNSGKKPQGAAAQIAALEAKLAAMKKAAPVDPDEAPRTPTGFLSASAGPAPSAPSPAPVSAAEEAAVAEAAPTAVLSKSSDSVAPRKAPSAATAAGLAGLPPKPVAP